MRLDVIGFTVKETPCRGCFFPYALISIIPCYILILNTMPFTRYVPSYCEGGVHTSCWDLILSCQSQSWSPLFEGHTISRVLCPQIYLCHSWSPVPKLGCTESSQLNRLVGGPSSSITTTAVTRQESPGIPSDKWSLFRPPWFQQSLVSDDSLAQLGEIETQEAANEEG